MKKINNKIFIYNINIIKKLIIYLYLGQIFYKIL